LKPFLFKKLAIYSVILAAVGCAATTGVRSIGNDTYTINVYRGDAGKVKQRAYEHAIKFCADQKSQGIEVVSENLRPDPATPNSNGGIIDLNFKCNGPISPINIKAAPAVPVTQPAPILVTPAKKVIPMQGQTSDSSRKLIELKNLLDSGVITQKDYDTKKQEILKSM
jgi:hypothetical protein